MKVTRRTFFQTISAIPFIGALAAAKPLAKAVAPGREQFLTLHTTLIDSAYELMIWANSPERLTPVDSRGNKSYRGCVAWELGPEVIDIKFWQAVRDHNDRLGIRERPARETFFGLPSTINPKLHPNESWLIDNHNDRIGRIYFRTDNPAGVWHPAFE